MVHKRKKERTQKDENPQPIDAPKKTNPTACSALEASQMLNVEPSWIDEDLKSGAPKNPDGTLNVVVYTAWLLKEGD